MTKKSKPTALRLAFFIPMLKGSVAFFYWVMFFLVFDDDFRYQTDF